MQVVGATRPTDKILSRGKIEVSVLDAAAIGVSILRNDIQTAGSIMFLLGIGELLEECTHKKSVGDLARSMALNIDKVWLVRNGQEFLVPSTEIEAAHLADKLVPYTPGGTALTYLLTRYVTKALAILTVDFSCALKLCMQISVLSAIR